MMTKGGNPFIHRLATYFHCHYFLIPAARFPPSEAPFWRFRSSREESASSSSDDPSQDRFSQDLVALRILKWLKIDFDTRDFHAL